MDITDNTAVNPVPFSDALLLGIATATSYFIAFAYEAGIASFYNIPSHLIEVRVSSICTAAASLVLAAMLFAQVLAVFNPYRTEFGRGDPIKYEIAHSLRLLFAFIPFVLVLGWKNLNLLVIAGAILVFQVALTFLLPLVAFRKLPTYREKMAAAIEADQPALAGTRRIYMPFGRERSLVLFAGLLLAALAWSAGYGQASAARDYWVTAAEPRRVLLRSYGDKSILAALKKAGPEIGPDYSVVPTTALGQVTYQRIGPLKVAAPRQSNAARNPAAPANKPLQPTAAAPRALQTR